MIVVAIIGVLMALATTGWRRAGVKRDIHGAMGEIESALRTARNLASLAGGNIGSGSLTNCAAINGGGVAPAGDVDHVSVNLDGVAQQLVYPVRLNDLGGGLFTTDCDTIDLSGFQSDGLTAELLVGNAPGTVVTIAFSQMGRPYSPPNAPNFASNRWNVGVRSLGGERVVEEGFQILPSGVLCRRQLSGLPVGAPIACDEN